AELYARERNRGTLMCHYRHRAHDDPFVYPGLQDITAWVDFTALAEAGVASGLQLAGYATQSHFLLGCGIDQRFDEMRRDIEDEAQLVSLKAQLRRLMMPGEMGERFRVVALTRRFDNEMIGFSFRDLAATL
ncbi:MAG: SAM-dependent methyltransferase, partial [Gammaproteobacteria bacterium]|nr:SAM-dependent methyltransferase [Gammaproteobacteria bacterium]